MKTGIVYLVGAGPGDPGLITQKGLECLAQADVVVYDYLVDERLINATPAEAERIYVGKSYSSHAKEQFEINRLLVEKAKQGKVVVRLKGGDPFVLGRGGEEAAELANNDVSFEIVPGVTSAVAVPAYAGIPVTHRKVAASFAVITGHEDPTKPDSSINWAKLATGADTLIFLMGVQNLPAISAKLIEYGRRPDTSVAVIKDGTRPQQKTVLGTLQNITDKVGEQKLTPPAVIVVGEVVKLRGKLRWFDNRPLFGKRVLVTRSRHQASELSKLLAERGAQPVELPAIEIKPNPDTAELDKAILNLAGYHWILFTSVNGVEAFFKHLHIFKLDSRALKGLKIGVIGPATAMSLEQRGIIPDFSPNTFTTAGIINDIRKMNISGQEFLLPRADIADKKLTEGLEQLGAKTHDIAVYKTVPVENSTRLKTILASGEIDVITFASSATVSNLLKALNGEIIDSTKIKIACIGPKTAETAVRSGLMVDIMASEHTIPGLVQTIEEYFKKEAD